MSIAMKGFYCLLCLAFLSGISARSLTQVTSIKAALNATDDLRVLKEAIMVFPELEAAVNNMDAALTVFAPTNQAILGALEKLGVGSLQGFVDAFPVKDILSYHILGAAAMSTDLVHGQAIFPLLAGSRLIPDLKASSAPIIRARNSAAKVVTADIMAGKSVIHIIDTVLLPVNPMKIEFANPAEAAVMANLTALVAALDKANLTAALADPELVATIFAPTDAAFEAVLTSLNLTLDTIPVDVLTAVLTYHVAPGYGPTARMVAEGEVKTLLTDKMLQWVYPSTDSDLPIVKSDMSNATIVAGNVFAGKSVIHVIDTVLLPKM